VSKNSLNLFVAVTCEKSKPMNIVYTTCFNLFVFIFWLCDQSRSGNLYIRLIWG